MERAITDIIDPSLLKAHKLPYHLYDIGPLDYLLYGCWCYHGSTNLANYYFKSVSCLLLPDVKKDTLLPGQAYPGAVGVLILRYLQAAFPTGSRVGAALQARHRPGNAFIIYYTKII